MYKVYVIQNDKEIVIAKDLTEEEAESFCEIWGWFYSDNQLFGTCKSYALICEEY